MRAHYSHPDDVDLFTGLLSEELLPGTMVGPTLGCLLALQFHHLRRCDRFWYESGDPLVRFSPGQLEEVRAQGLAALLCRNMEQPGVLPWQAFDRVGRGNGLVECEGRGGWHLHHWRERGEGPSASFNISHA